MAPLAPHRVVLVDFVLLHLLWLQAAQRRHLFEGSSWLTWNEAPLVLSSELLFVARAGSSLLACSSNPET